MNDVNVAAVVRLLRCPSPLLLLPLICVCHLFSWTFACSTIVAKTKNVLLDLPCPIWFSTYSTSPPTSLLFRSVVSSAAALPLDSDVSSGLLPNAPSSSFSTMITSKPHPAKLVTIFRIPEKQLGRRHHRRDIFMPSTCSPRCLRRSICKNLEIIRVSQPSVNCMLRRRPLFLHMNGEV